MKLNRRQLRRLIMESFADSSYAKRTLSYEGINPTAGPFTMTCQGKNSPNEWVCYVDFSQKPQFNKKYNIVGGFTEIQEIFNRLVTNDILTGSDPIADLY